MAATIYPCISICTYVYTYTNTYTYVYQGIHTCIYVYVYLCRFAPACLYSYKYTYIHLLRKASGPKQKATIPQSSPLNVAYSGLLAFQVYICVYTHMYISLHMRDIHYYHVPMLTEPGKSGSCEVYGSRLKALRMFGGLRASVFKGFGVG